ncbi:hypothetical protein [Streptomyces tubercidicus]|uniref:hypothetical protein n=1 Tax=Streptomyces tubercidicus TaxID=47759 RepID=UPI002E10A1E5|nr:hypothetical protein OG761_17570 [Streptomyces tubercidicus]
MADNVMVQTRPCCSTCLGLRRKCGHGFRRRRDASREIEQPASDGAEFVWV